MSLPVICTEQVQLTFHPSPILVTEHCGTESGPLGAEPCHGDRRFYCGFCGRQLEDDGGAEWGASSPVLG